MAELKTKPTEKSVEDFLSQVENEKRRSDCFALVKLMKQVTGEKPKMWGPSMVGFGKYHYKYESGREGDYFITGFSPRKKDLTLYLMGGLHQYPEIMKRLGKFKTGKSCLYLKSLDDVDPASLKQLIAENVKSLRAKK